MTVTVIIVTLNRADCVRRCLDCLRRQVPAPDELIVVDASDNDLTRDVVAATPGVLYLRNEHGFGRMTASRNIGIQSATGEVIAFVDDDAFVHPGWLAAMLETYLDPTVGAAGGRVLNQQPDEEKIGREQIGQLLPNGTLTGNFAADPGRVIEVEHVMGCNMSYRREVMARLGGFREDYPGISGVREDTDMCLRVKKLGWRILFNPRMIVDHLGAPQAVGKRFDVRYNYYTAHNHTVLLIRNYGLTARKFWNYLGWTGVQSVGNFVRRVGGALVNITLVLVGTILGIVSGLRLIGKTSSDPVRHDVEGQTIRNYLTAIGQRSKVPDAE